MSKKILFHAEQLNYRGTTNSILDYAKYNREILGNESAIMYSAKSPDGKDVGTEQAVVELIKRKYPVYQYDDYDQANDIASGFDLCYSQRAGLSKDRHTGEPYLNINTTKFGVHSVFQWHDPHGDVYAYISEWLSKKVSEAYNTKEHPYVPYVVHLPPPNRDVRADLGISRTSTVIGRLGGFQTFDIDFAKETVAKVLEKHKDYVFIFLNTEKFIHHERALFLPAVFSQQQKANIIHACDAMLHARTLGESFGLSICEFLFMNKPVLAWDGGFDRNHIELLKDHNLIYLNENDLYEKLVNIRSFIGKKYNKIVAPYGPYNVIKRFESVFLI